MRKKQRQDLMNLLEIQSKSRRTWAMTDYVSARLEQLGMEIERDEYGQILARKGDTRGQKVPYYVAHADTVFDIVPAARRRVGFEDRNGDRYYFAYDPGTGEYRGVGGDDKCGIFLCIEAAKRLRDVVVLITVDEEIGGVGARSLTRKVFEDAAVLIQADRRGNNEAIFECGGTISSQAWRDHVDHIVRSYGYHWSDRGIFTDVSLLVEDRISPVSAVNIGAGYWNYHSPREYISENDLKRAVALGIALGRASAGRAWPHIPQYAWEHAEGYGRHSQRVTYDGDGMWVDGTLIPYEDIDGSMYGWEFDDDDVLGSDYDVPPAIRGSGNTPDRFNSRFWDDDDDLDGGYEPPKEMSHEEMTRAILTRDAQEKARQKRADQMKREPFRRGSGSSGLSLITCKIMDCDRPTHGVTVEGEWLCEKHYREASEAKAKVMKAEAQQRIEQSIRHGG